MDLIINPVAVGATRRFRQEANLLVIADGLQVAACGVRQIAAVGARVFATNQGDDPLLTPYSSTERIIIAIEVTMAKAMTISRAAERAGVGVETIRFYERRGLIEQPLPPRSGGYRFYDDTVVERIRFIRQAQELGFSLREITELLSLRADPAADCGDVRAQAVAKREEVDRKMMQLQHIRAALDALIASCPGGGALRACTIIDALAGRSGSKANRSEAAEPTPPGELRSQQRKAKGYRMKTTIFKIDGMHCEGCARTVRALISTTPGVQNATVSFKTLEARILFDPQAVSEDHLTATIRQAGYSVVG